MKIRTLCFSFSLAIGAVLCAWAQSVKEPGEIALRPKQEDRFLLIEPILKYPKRVTLGFPRGGRIAEVMVEEGDKLTAGQTIAILEREDLRAAMELAEAKAVAEEPLLVAQAEERSAQFALESAKKANQLVSNAVALQELRRLELDSEKSVATRKLRGFEQMLARIEYKKAKVEFDAHCLAAPWDGILVVRKAQKGMAAEPGQGLFELVATDTLRVEGHLPLQIAWKLPRNHGCRVEVDSEAPIVGKISFVDVTAQPIRGFVRAWAEIPAGERLHEGMSVSVILDPL